MRLSFDGFQTLVLIIFAVIALALAAVFVLVALQGRREVEFETVRRIAYRMRPAWLAFLVLALFGLVAVSLFFTPYSGRADATASVNVSGGQFYWSLSPPQVRVGSRVRFDVTSVDVNHGFGIYDPDGHLLGSVQAMPGYHNHLDVTLDQPGNYLISCLEFCGAKHHEMSRELEVRP
jgi:cytochrome c oxidase subunit II